MTSANKKQEVQAIVEGGKLLVSQAETLLKNLVLRNTRLSQEMKQIRSELEEKLTQLNK